MKLLGLIPARGGSRRLIGKNLIDLAGKPLLVWTIEAALRSFMLDVVAVSTDDVRIKECALAHDCVVIDRPLERAQGEQGSMLRTVNHALDAMPDFDAVVLLQPTSPLRTPADIQRAIKGLGDDDSLVSVRPDGQPNGAIYITRAAALRRGEQIYSDHSVRYRMPFDRSVDIDTDTDLQRARSLMLAAHV